jgi:hypothetical protein
VGPLNELHLHLFGRERSQEGSVIPLLCLTCMRISCAPMPSSSVYRLSHLLDALVRHEPMRQNLYSEAYHPSPSG